MRTTKRPTAAVAYMRTAVAYLRVSTDDQRLGPEAQQAAIEQYTSNTQTALVASYLDRGVSGVSPLHERPALMQALDHAKALTKAIGGVVSLVIAKRDRLARDMHVLAHIETHIPKGIELVSADGVGNGTRPEDVFLRTLMGGVAQYERALIIQRTKLALRAKRARGECAGEVPYGYRRNGARLEPEPAEVHVIERVHALASLGTSQRGIVRVLEAEGLLSRAGTPFRLSQVQRLLARPAAA